MRPFDVIVIGSGPGGATVARELARAGKQTLILERGADHYPRAHYGTYLGALLYTDRASLLFTEEGQNIIRPMLVGGATSMYCGCAARPPRWFKTKYGIDLSAEASETIEELEIAPLPADLRGAASTQIAEAGRALGQGWEPQMKFMRPLRARRFDCGAKCMIGCRCGAKWNAREFVMEAIERGAELRTGAHIKRVLMEGGRAAGMEGTLNGRPFTAKAETVIVAAGGIGSPRLLQASGFRDAGNGITMDTTVMVYGLRKQRGNGHEPPMTWSWDNDEAGYKLSTLIDPWLLYPLMAALKHTRYALFWPCWNDILGVMIKLKDDVSGGVFPNRISKPMTASDQERLRLAEDVARRILLEAGADRATLFTTPLRGTHPSSSVRIGALLDSDLQTEVKGLYVCDASTFPEALGQPTVLTIISLAKRLARHLLR